MSTAGSSSNNSSDQSSNNGSVGARAGNLQSLLKSNVKLARPSKKVFEGLTSPTVTITDAECKSFQSPYFKNLKDCQITLESRCTRVFMEACSNITLKLNAPITTSTLEIWKSNDVTVEVPAHVSLQLIQADVCQRLSVSFTNRSQFDTLIWTLSEDIDITIASETTPQPFKTGLALMQAKYQDVFPEIDQFVVRFVENVMQSEIVVRIAGGYATTVREDDEFISKQAALDSALRDQVTKSIMPAPTATTTTASATVAAPTHASTHASSDIPASAAAAAAAGETSSNPSL